MILTCLCVSAFLYSWEIGLTLRSSPGQLEMMWRFLTLPLSISHKEQFAGLNPDLRAAQGPSWFQPHSLSALVSLSSLCFIWVLCGSLSLCLSICLYFSKVPEKSKQWLLFTIWGKLWSFTHLFIHSSISCDFFMCLKDVCKCTLPTPGGLEDNYAHSWLQQDIHSTLVLWRNPRDFRRVRNELNRRVGKMGNKPTD